MFKDPVIPLCARVGVDGRQHHCTELCPEADGLACSPPAGDWWLPRCDGRRPGDFQHNYRRLRAVIPGELDELQRRYLRWLAGWDLPTTDALIELFEIAAGSSPRVVADRRRSKARGRR